MHKLIEASDLVLDHEHFCCLEDDTRTSSVDCGRDDPGCSEYYGCKANREVLLSTARYRFFLNRDSIQDSRLDLNNFHSHQTSNTTTCIKDARINAILESQIYDPRQQTCMLPALSVAVQ